MTGVYRAGSSLLHRTPAGWKLVGLSAFTTALLLWRAPEAVLAGLVLVLLGYAVAGWGPPTALAQVWRLRWILLLLVPFQWWTHGWRVTAVVVGTLVVAVAAAALVTLTTRVTDLLDALVTGLRPLRRLGLDPERAGLGLALAIRAVPVIGACAQEVSAARRARGLERSMRALAVPLVVRTVRHAQRTGDALAARGLDD